ncbi:hypothetical protein DMN91_010204 [Ooceraea biroi]|uniref:Uncharacterized protein n=1 Tax=Ooceraea biroi TaxID=2015173 RepID=A0A3L8DCV2_OOCBI|nr:hypothetical protein DMN91_010204 [Ooceraea biroi]
MSKSIVHFSPESIDIFIVSSPHCGNPAEIQQKCGKFHSIVTIVQQPPGMRRFGSPRKLFRRRKREREKRRERTEGFSSASSCFPFVTNKRNSCERTSATGLLSRRSFEAGNGKGGARGAKNGTR